jgi:hypothetical protein
MSKKMSHGSDESKNKIDLHSDGESFNSNKKKSFILSVKSPRPSKNLTNDK